MENAKHAEIPMSLSLTLDDSKSKPLETEDHHRYRCLIRRLMFMAVGTRADLAFSVNRLSQYLSEPRIVHLQAAKHILRYLINKTKLGILYTNERLEPRTLIGFADAAYANARESRSTLGNCFLITGGPVTWTSQKQSITAQSTTESEYISLSDATKQVI